MKQTPKILAALALAVALIVTPLVACTTTSGEDGNGTAPAADTIDTSAWQTMADALETADDCEGYSYLDGEYATVLTYGDSYVRILADITDEIQAQIDELDIFDEDYDAKFNDAIAACAIKSAEDITANQISESDLAAYVGKTGQDLLDAGFTFSSYYMYGENPTGTFFDKGYFGYEVLFDIQLSEPDDEDGGAAVADAVITEIACVGIGDSALELGIE